MEVVGFVASVGALLKAVSFVQTTLGDYRKGGRDRDRLLAEVDSLKKLLESLEADGENADKSGKEEPWLDIIGQLFESGGTFQQIEDVISEVKLKIERRPGFRGALVNWTWPFVKEDVDRNVRQIRRLADHVSVVLQKASLLLTRAINERVTRVDKITSRRELRAILEWLSSLYFREQQYLDSNKACPGTCEWFLTSPEYSAWKQKQHRVLYCSAIGGAGKTILASVAIDDLSRMAAARQNTAIFIIYCKHDKPDTHSVDKLAMTMLRQLVQLKQCEIPPDLEELLERHYYTSETRPSLGEVLNVINAHLRTFSQNFIVVDGLDEIMNEESRESIITFLMRLEAAPQLMFTSRPIELIERMFLSTTYEVETDGTESIDDEEESDVGWDHEDTDYDSEEYSYDNGAEEEDSSDESSDQESSESSVENDSQPPVRAPPNESDTSLFADEDGSQNKDENNLLCSKCNKKLSQLQYHCYECLRNRSIICMTCYDSGTRCVNGDSRHDSSVRIRTRCLKMDVYARPRAVRRYVRMRTGQSTILVKFTTQKPGFAEEIEDIVTGAAQKMFLLAQLHMDALSNPNLLKFSEVRYALDHLPAGLNDSYDSAMMRTTEHGKHLLRLVSYAQRPLSMHEVEHALALTPDSDEILDDEIIPARTLISRCAGLVTLDENDEVVFSHYTIVGYFAERSNEIFGNGHKYMAETCLSYLSLREFQRGPVQEPEEAGKFEARVQAYPYFEYASIFWGVHAQSSKDYDVLDIAYDFIGDHPCCGASVQALQFSADEISVSWRSRSGGSPLHLAMHYKYHMLAARLLRDGANADIRDAFGITPLMWAAQAGYVGMTETILATNVPLNAINDKGSNALHIAILGDREDVAVLLIDQPGMDVNAPFVGDRRWRKVTPLMLAAHRDQLEIAQKLLTRPDILINAQDSAGATIVHHISSAKNRQMMKAIANAPNIDLDYRDEIGRPGLIEACYSYNLSAIQALLDAGADINVREGPLNSDGSALMRAADYDAVDIVYELIRRNIDWNAKDSLGRTAIHSAAINGSDGSMPILLDLPGIDIDLQDINGNTPIHDAAGLYDPTVLKMLLSKGARTDIRNHRGKTPLDTARAQRARKNVLILKEKHAQDFGIPKRSMTGMSMGEPTLSEAAAQGDEAAVASILATYADDKSVNIEERDDWTGRTPLQLAADAGYLRIVKKLHQAGADINIQDKYGRTALHIAALRRRMPIARYLLRHGADWTKEDIWRSNVVKEASAPLQILLLQHDLGTGAAMNLEYLLFLAAKQGNMKVVRRLIEAGADVQAKDWYGQSPYELARQEGQTAVARYLDQIGRSVAQSSSAHVSKQNTNEEAVEPARAAAVTEAEVRSNTDGDDHVSSQQRPADVHDELKESPTKPQISAPHSSLMTEFMSVLAGIRNYIIVFLIALILGYYMR